MGLGLTHKRLLGLTPREHEALRRMWERQSELSMLMYQNLRADIYNSSENLNRSDKRRWTAQDFGADAPPQSQERPRSPTREEVRTRAIMKFGPGENGSVLKTLKGQRLPAEIQARINSAKPSKPVRKRSPAYNRLKGEAMQ